MVDVEPVCFSDELAIDSLSPVPQRIPLEASDRQQIDDYSATGMVGDKGFMISISQCCPFVNIHKDKIS